MHSEQRGSEGGPEQPKSWHRGDSQGWGITVCHSTRGILKSDCRPTAVSPTGSQLREVRARDLQLLQLAPVLSFHSSLPSEPPFPGFGPLGCVTCVQSELTLCTPHQSWTSWAYLLVAVCLAALTILWLFQLLPDPTLSSVHTCLPKYQVSWSCPTGLSLTPLNGGWFRQYKEVWQSYFGKKPGATEEQNWEGTKDIWAGMSWRQV